VLVSLFAVLSSAASVSGQTMTGTGPAMSTSSYSSGIIDYFAVDTSGTLWHTTGSGTWDSLGGVATSSPAAVSWPFASCLREDVFVRGTDGALWQTCYQNGWSTWIPLGGQLASGTGPAVSSWSAGRLDVFVQGTDGALWHKWWNGAKWSGWESLGGKLTASPAATWWWGGPTSTSTSIQVFVRGSDGAVWQKYWDGSAWSSWHSLGGKLAPGTGPAVSQDLNLFVQGTDNQLWHESVGVSGWSTLAGAPPETLSTASPGAVLDIQDHTGVSISSTSGNVWYSVYDLGNPNFGQWSSAGRPP
jgi:hypothetical protein